MSLPLNGTEFNGEDNIFPELLDCIKDCTGASSVFNVNSLHENVAFWRYIHADSFVLSWIVNGVFLPFRSIPPTLFFTNNLSTRDHNDFVCSEILSLLSSGRISEVPTPPFFVHPLSVAVNKEKPRLILDCSYFNQRKSILKWKT